MPVVDTRISKGSFPVERAVNMLDANVRRILAPALSTPSMKLDRDEGLIHSIIEPLKSDPRFDIVMTINAYDLPERVYNRQSIADTILAHLFACYPRLNIGVWLDLGAHRVWVSSYDES